MANYTDQYYDEVDSLYDRLRESAFKETMVDPTPQDSTDAPLGPVGWVENADEADGVATVKINSDGITVIDGSIVVSNGSGTVVIDGTSNMFKILASGTLTATAADPGSPPSSATSDSDAVTLSGLGTFTETPGHIAFVGDDFLVTDSRYIGRKATSVSVDEHDIIGTKTVATTFTKLDANDECVVTLNVSNFVGGSTRTATARYHLLKEAAI